MVAERLGVRVPDASMVLRADRPDLEAIRQPPVRNRLGQVSQHQEPVADDRVALALVQCDGPCLALVRPRLEGPRTRPAVDARDLDRAPLGPLEERPSETTSAPGGSDPSLDLVDGDAVAGPDVGLGGGY